MDAMLARAIILEMNEKQLRDVLLHIVIRTRCGQPITWLDIQDLLDKAMAAKKVA